MEEFKQRLNEVAQRAVAAAPRCANEESTKMFLVLPVISVLGYDHTNPNEVFPEHHCDFSEKYKNRVDFAILRNKAPIIAIECKPVGASIKDDRGQLRSYFNAARSVKMGVLTDGLVWEFYADSDEPNMMDEHPFLTVDLRDAASGKLPDASVEALSALSKLNFDPDNIGAEAKRKHVHNSVLQQIAALYREPSEAFARTLLQGAGLSRVSQRTIDDYRPIILSAFREFINQQILHRLDIPKVEPVAVTPIVVTPAPEQVPARAEEKVTTTEGELYVFRWVQQRLAFLAEDDKMFAEIENVQYRDYQGKFAVFYKMERRGRLFDLYERKGGDAPLYRFVFPEDSGLDQKELSTNSLIDLDKPLLTLFQARVADLTRSKAVVQ